MELFNDYRQSIVINEHIKSKHIIVGDYSYYSGYYHNLNFEDCVMYLDAKDNKYAAKEIDQLIIGKFCSIATGVKFMMGGTHGHNSHWIATYPLDFLDDDFDNYESISPKGHRRKGNTIIGNDVWVGAEAMIMPGVQIADGAIIGARSLVTKNIGPYEIWGGNPARLIRTRFNEVQIQKLLQLQWWNWELSKIKQHIHLIRSDKVEDLWEQAQ